MFSAMSIKDIQTGLAARDFSAREIAQAALSTIEIRDEQVHAFLELTSDMAFKAADALDTAIAAGEELPLLAGVPIAFKDNMNIEGTHTTCASRMLANYTSPFTASCVTRALVGGAIPLGKLNMDEFAFGSSTETSFFGRTHNPWDLERVPGGSSGGSAAAVAAGMATITLGSDTGGSIRQPAAFCGVIGFKPSYGVISRNGVVAFASSLDQVGPFGRTVADVAITMDALAGVDPLDVVTQPHTTSYLAATEQGVKNMRVGIVPSFLEAVAVEPEVVQVLEGAIQHLKDLGVEIVEVDLPHAKLALSAYYIIGPCEAFSNLSRFDSVRYGYRDTSARNLDEMYTRGRAQGFGAETRRRIMLGSYLLSSGVYDTYYYPAQQARTLIVQDFKEAFERVDALLTPTSPRTAFRFGEITDPTAMYYSDIFTIPANIAGNGGMNLPVGLGATTGLPVGMHIMGPQLRDENIFRVAAALEACYPSRARLAPLAANVPAAHSTNKKGGAQ